MLEPGVSVAEHFAQVEDPRTGPAIQHKLIDILVIALCGVICGADGWSDIETFGKAKQDWLKNILELPNGIPSHDTFGRVFARLDPEQFSASLISWTRAISTITKRQVIAIDGKTVRRSHDRRLGKKAIHMVSAWATENRLTLGQVKVDDKSNEITAIPELLRLLDVSGCIVTIDAMGCQREIADQIIAQGGDYVLAVKDNQPGLYLRIKQLFEHGHKTAFRHLDYDDCARSGKDHGRQERRVCWAMPTPEWNFFLDHGARWPHLRTAVQITAHRTIDGKTTHETRFYISSLAVDAEQLLHAVRSHWGIENSLHWVLDVAFREDDCRVRIGNAPFNLSLLRRLATDLLRSDKTTKRGIKGKRLKAAWDMSYLLRILVG
jgi:predicted transposase YbfD/YdcC